MFGWLYSAIAGNNSVKAIPNYIMKPKKGECLRWNQNGIFRKNKSWLDQLKLFFLKMLDP